MKRPIPTKQLLIELSGNDKTLIASMHHGLYELSLKDFYSNLDLEELLVFAASSWKAREKDFNAFSYSIKNLDVYELFDKVFDIGYKWLNKYKNISEELDNKYNKLNPFNGKNLRSRLEEIDKDKAGLLKDRLGETVNEYVFEIQYYERKMQRGEDNYKLEIMNFFGKYPNKKLIVPGFASEIARIISGYPRDYIDYKGTGEKDTKILEQDYSLF